MIFIGFGLLYTALKDHQWSSVGISLLIGKDQTINTGDELDLSFFKTGVMKRINVKCKVVRLFKVGEYNAAGCVFSGISSDLTLFVAEKKREYNSKLNIKVAG